MGLMLECDLDCLLILLWFHMVIYIMIHLFPRMNVSLFFVGDAPASCGTSVILKLPYCRGRKESQRMVTIGSLSGSAQGMGSYRK